MNFTDIFAEGLKTGRSAKPEALKAELLRNLTAQFAAGTDRHIPADGIIHTTVPGLQIHVLTRQLHKRSVIGNPGLIFFLRGTADFFVGERLYETKPGDAMILNFDMPCSWIPKHPTEEAPFMAVYYTFEQELLEECIAQFDSHPHRSNEAEASTMVPAETELAAAVLRLMLLSHSKDEDIRVLGPIIKREILWRILSQPCGMSLRLFAKPGSQCSRIREAVSWLNEHADENFEVDELAEKVDMAPSTFYRHFRSTTSLSPLQYHKALRLHMARRLLVNEALEAVNVAHKVGYQSAAQFSREYKRLFGLPPGADRNKCIRDNYANR